MMSTAMVMTAMMTSDHVVIIDSDSVEGSSLKPVAGFFCVLCCFVSRDSLLSGRQFIGVCGGICLCFYVVPMDSHLVQGSWSAMMLFFVCFVQVLDVFMGRQYMILSIPARR